MTAELKQEREKAEQLAQERVRLEARLGLAHREFHGAVEQLAATDVDDPTFPALVAQREVARTRIDLLEPRVRVARERATDARMALARMEQRAAAPAPAVKKREVISWEL